MIEFRSVGKQFADGTRAVADFSLTIPSHTTTVFVGPSGCGKTTLLRSINRMVDLTEGQILIDGEDIATRDPVTLRRSIGYVMQHAGLLPHRRVIANVATQLRLNGVPKTEARRRSAQMLTTVGLDESVHQKYPSQLSGGQQQRVGVARALVNDPNILLMDEPFSAVDPIVRAELRDEMVRLQQELQKTIVFVTHDIEEAFAMGDQVVVLKTGGEVAQVGSPLELLTQPADAFVEEFLGLQRGGRTLQVQEVHGRRVVVDEHGRPAGVLE